MSPIKFGYGKTVYGIFDVLGAWGGVKGAIDLFWGTVYAYIASHAFLTSAVSSLYFAKTTDALLLSGNQGDENRGNPERGRLDVYRRIAHGNLSPAE